jgi:hypothetical protein
MVDLVLQTFNQVTMGYCDSVATRNLALLITSIVLYAIFLGRDRRPVRAHRYLRCADSVLRG